jgi:hypothetical protein
MRGLVTLFIESPSYIRDRMMQYEYYLSVAGLVHPGTKHLQVMGMEREQQYHLSHFVRNNLHFLKTVCFSEKYI